MIAWCISTRSGPDRGGDGFVDNSDSSANVYPPLKHAEWHGCTPTDLIFPFFLFIAGVAIPIALGGRLEQGARKSQLVAKIVRRSLLIFAIGLLLSRLPNYDLRTIRDSRCVTANCGRVWGMRAVVPQL